MVASITFRISHGYDVAMEGRDELLELAEEALLDFGVTTTPGAFLVDVFPFCTFRSLSVLVLIQYCYSAIHSFLVSGRRIQEAS